MKFSAYRRGEEKSILTDIDISSLTTTGFVFSEMPREHDSEITVLPGHASMAFIVRTSVVLRKRPFENEGEAKQDNHQMELGIKGAHAVLIVNTDNGATNITLFYESDSSVPGK